MFILGLTGSIGMGKSTTAKFFAEEGVPVHDADAVVHKLYDGEASAAIEAAFPGTTVNGKVDRETLAKRVLGEPAKIKRPGMSEQKLAAIMANQVSDAEKRARADFVVDTSKSFEHARAQVRDILKRVSAMVKRAQN